MSHLVWIWFLVMFAIWMGALLMAWMDDCL